MTGPSFGTHPEHEMTRLGCCPSGVSVAALSIACWEFQAIMNQEGLGGGHGLGHISCSLGEGSSLDQGTDDMAPDRSTAWPLCRSHIHIEFEKMQHHKGSFPLLLPAVHAKFMSLSGPHLLICIAPYQATSPATELAISDTPTGERMKQSTSPATNPRQHSSD